MTNQTQDISANTATCPICHKSGTVPVTSEPANFFRCDDCHQAVKLNAAGRLVPWIDIYSAGRQRKTAHNKAEGKPAPQPISNRANRAL